jgi:hypothetical protein
MSTPLTPTQEAFLKGLITPEYVQEAVQRFVAEVLPWTDEGRAQDATDTEAVETAADQFNRFLREHTFAGRPDQAEAACFVINILAETRCLDVRHFVAHGQRLVDSLEAEQAQADRHE